MTKMKRSRVLLVALTLISFAVLSTASADTDHYIVAVVPQFPATQINHDWAPLLAALERKTGYHFQLRVYELIPQFENELLQGLPDFAYMNPYHMVMAKHAHNYRPLIRDRVSLFGIIVVKKDGAIKSLADLTGTTIAFPSPNALGGSLYIRALLGEKEMLTFNPVYVGSHQTVYRQVLRGDVQAGGGVTRTLDKEPERVRDQLRVLYSTPEVASHPLAAHPRVPNIVSQRIVDAVLAIANDADEQAILDAVLLSAPVVADFERDYSQLVKLNLGKYAEGTGP